MVTMVTAEKSGIPNVFAVTKLNLTVISPCNMQILKSQCRDFDPWGRAVNRGEVLGGGCTICEGVT